MLKNARELTNYTEPDQTLPHWDVESRSSFIAQELQPSIGDLKYITDITIFSIFEFYSMFNSMFDLKIFS